MKIQMRSLYAGPAGVIQAGETVDLADCEALDLVAGGYAVSLESAPVESADESTDGAESAAVVVKGKGRKK